MAAGAGADRGGEAVTVDEHRFDPGAGAELLDHRVGQRDARHLRRPRASRRARESSTVGLSLVRARRARSAGVTFGARRARSASLVSSAGATTDPSCSPLRSPACAAAATAGNDSNVRAVSSVSRTERADTPSRAATDSSIRPRSSSAATTASSSTRSRRCSRTNSSRRATSRSVGQHRNPSRRSTTSNMHHPTTGVRHRSPGRAPTICAHHTYGSGLPAGRHLGGSGAPAKLGVPGEGAPRRPHPA